MLLGCGQWQTSLIVMVMISSPLQPKAHLLILANPYQALNLHSLSSYSKRTPQSYGLSCPTLECARWQTTSSSTSRWPTSSTPPSTSSPTSPTCLLATGPLVKIFPHICFHFVGSTDKYRKFCKQHLVNMFPVKMKNNLKTFWRKSTVKYCFEFPRQQIGEKIPWYFLFLWKYCRGRIKGDNSGLFSERWKYFLWKHLSSCSSIFF